jgi:hypothetical protein
LTRSARRRFSVSSAAMITSSGAVL